KLLSHTSLKTLIQEGKDSKEVAWSFEELTQTIKEHYDFIFNLTQFELSRIHVKFNFSKDQKKQLLNWSDKNLVVVLQPHPEISFKPLSLPKLSNKLLSPAREEFAKIKKESESLCIPMSYHQTQVEHYAELGIST